MLAEGTTGEKRPWCKPIFRWAGSKRQLVPLLLASMPEEYNRYIEPMVGSACLFFAERPKRAILGDFNDELMLSYRTIRNHPRLVRRVAGDWSTTPGTYYEIREHDPETLSEIERSARFTYLNRFSFNGIYRTNKEGRFNVPCGRDTGSLPSEAQFYRCSVALRTAELTTGDFEETALLAGRGDFVYIDPPYSTSRPRHGEYGYGSFDSSDEKRLFDLLIKLDRRGAYFLLSYGGVAPVSGLPKEWFSTSFTSVRTVGGWVDRRHRTGEFLLANYRFAEAA